MTTNQSLGDIFRGHHVKIYSLFMRGVIINLFSLIFTLFICGGRKYACYLIIIGKK